jgi:RNA polymerase-binding transcription factor DksA
MSKKTKKIKENKDGLRSAGKSFIAFPSKLLIPVGNFLQNNLKKLEFRKKEIAKEDPFKNTARLADNASPDADAEEQFGHARTTAIKEQIDRKMIQTRKALTRIKIGKYGICEDCGKMIDTDRLVVYPEATLCASCQAKRER